MKHNLTFIIPAAGKSSRFQSKKNKIFYLYKKKELILHVVEKVMKFANQIIIVINKKNYGHLKKILSPYKIKANFTIVFQNQPKGMGHAIYLGLKKSKTPYSSVIWSDQIYLSIKTIKKTIKFFIKKNSLLTFPIFRKKSPYVYILKDKNKKFKDIVQTRETRNVIKVGDSDCGFFIFKTQSVYKKLKILIKKKLIITKQTKEIDFLRSFKYLKMIGKIHLVKAFYKKDTFGVNTLNDLI